MSRLACFSLVWGFPVYDFFLPETGGHRYSCATVTPDSGVLEDEWNIKLLTAVRAIQRHNDSPLQAIISYLEVKRL